MDNLDRTNVAQAAVARWTLNLQLKAAGILAENDKDQQEQIDIALRESTETVSPFLISMLIMAFQCGRSTQISFPKHMPELEL